MLIFVLEYTGRSSWLRPRLLLLLFALPVISLLLNWSNPWHALVWQDAHFQQQGGWMIPTYAFGPVHQVVALYLYVVIVLTGGVLLYQAVIATSFFYRVRLLILLFGLMLVAMTDMLYVAQVVPGLALTPFAEVLNMALLALVLFRYRGFDLVPVAHHVLVQRMQDSLIVMDSQLRLLDLNPASRHMLGLADAEDIIGKPANAVLPHWQKWQHLLATEQSAATEITLHQEHRIWWVFRKIRWLGWNTQRYWVIPSKLQHCSQRYENLMRVLRSS